MNGERLLNFFEFYLENEKDDIIEVEKVLSEEGIDAAGSERKVFEMINKAKIEAKIEKGRIFKKKFYESLGNIKSLLPQIEKDEPQLAMAFRKLEGEADELLDDKEKMLLMEYLRKRIAHG